MITEDYNRDVKELLGLYHVKIEAEVMPQLSKDLTTFYMGITELYGKLKNRGLIKDDPYLSNSGEMDIVLPDTEAFPESEASWKVPQRICKYIAVLSYITHNYTLSLNNIDFLELEKIKKFVDFYDWGNINNSVSKDFNTNCISKLVFSLKKSINDSLIISTIDKCIDTISDSHKKIISSLKYVLLYLKESYKQFIRLDIIPLVANDEFKSNLGLFFEKITEEMKTNYSYLKVYKKYIKEVLDEDFSQDGVELKKKVLKLLGQSRVQNKNKPQKEDPYKILNVGLLELGKVRSHLAKSIDKLNLNHETLSSRNRGFIKKILYLISRFLFNIPPKTVYRVTLTSNNKKQNEEIFFEKFFSKIRNHEFILLELAEEGRVQSYIEKNREDIENNVENLLLHLKKDIRYLIALDEFFKIELRSLGLKSKGIKPELTVLKTIINSATSSYREFLETLEKVK